MNQIENSKEAVIAEITKGFEPVKLALERAGFVVKFDAYAGQTGFRAGAHVSVRKPENDFWRVIFHLEAAYNSGVIGSVKVEARPARTVHLSYGKDIKDKLVKRVKAAWEANLKHVQKTKDDQEYGQRWAEQALRDVLGMPVPDCVLPSWRLDNAKSAKARTILLVENMHAGMPNTPIGRYFPKIDNRALCGAGGLTAAQLKFLCDCLCKLPTIT